MRCQRSSQWLTLIEGRPIHGDQPKCLEVKFHSCAIANTLHGEKGEDEIIHVGARP